MPVLGAVATPRPSCVVGLDASARLASLAFADTDDAILAALPSGVRVIGVDAPLAVPNPRGARPVDQLLQWLDVPAFPCSRERLDAVFGGARGPEILPRLAAGGARVVETLPDLVLRELAWEAGRAGAAAPLGLADYRAAWLGVRAPRYRPKGTGRAHPGGRGEAFAILSSGVDAAGWEPHPDPDDWQAIRDAAVLDALAAGYAAWRLAVAPGAVVLIGDRAAPLAVPADANLRDRARLHGERLGVPVADAAADGPRSDADGA